MHIVIAARVRSTAAKVGHGAFEPRHGGWGVVLGWGMAVLALALPTALTAGLITPAPGSAVDPVLALGAIQLALGGGAGAAYLLTGRRGLGEPILLPEGPCPLPAAAPADGRERDLLHELRATVGGLALASRLLRQEGQSLSGEMRERLGHLMEAEVGRLDRMLDDDPPGRLETVELDAIIDPLVEALRLQGRDVVHRSAHLQAIGRRDEIAEVVHVLLENAVRHGGGSRIELEVVQRDGTVEVWIRDFGDGIEPAVVPVLFGRGARSSGSPGEGIGLHIARRLAHGMGGRLRLQPDPQTPGASFVLSLPGALQRERRSA